MRAAVVLIWMALGACDQAAGDPHRRSLRAPISRAEDHLVTEIVTRHGAVDVQCRRDVAGRDVAGQCDAVAADGRIIASSVRAARDLGLDRSLILRDGGELVVERGAGELFLDRDVLAVDARGELVAYARAAPADQSGAALPAQELIVADLAAGTRRRGSRHPLDGSLFLVPGTGEILFVSARTGLASLWLRAGDGAERQLTNVGQTEITDDFVPVPGAQLTWVPGARVAIYAAHHDHSRLWSLDLDSGEVRELGPGRLPVAVDGGVAAWDGGWRAVDPRGGSVRAHVPSTAELAR